MKKLLKKILPPFVVDVYKSFRKINLPEYSGDFDTWAKAREGSLGYDDATFFKKVITAREKVLQGISVMEQDGTSFPKMSYSFPVMAALQYIARKENKLSIIDFGGGLGTSFDQNKHVLEDVNVDWRILEQPHYVQYGKKMEKGTLHFFDTMEEATATPYNSILFSGVLGYIENVVQQIEKLISKSPKYVIVDRTVMSDISDRITVQTHRRPQYEISLPIRIFDVRTFTEKFFPNYIVLYEWEGGRDTTDFGTVSAHGFFLKRKEFV